jgi:hypothetical protein
MLIYKCYSGHFFDTQPLCSMNRYNRLTLEERPTARAGPAGSALKLLRIFHRGGYRAWKTIYSRRSTESVCPSEEVTFGALSFVFPRRPYAVDWKVHPGQQLGALWKHGKLHNVKRGSYLCWSIWFSTFSKCPCGGKLSFVSTKHNPPPTAEWSTLSFCYEVLSF